MGFFSQVCRGCNHSVRADVAVNKTSRWMNEAVVLVKGGGKVMGCYDGYGRLENGHRYEDEDTDLFHGQNEVWHRTCWHLSGKPTKFTHASAGAHDQGYFVGEYDPPEPKTVQDMNALAVEGERAAKEHKAFLRKMHEQVQQEKADRDALDSSGL